MDSYDLIYYSLIQNSIAREAMNMGLLSNNEKHEAGNFMNTYYDAFIIFCDELSLSCLKDVIIVDSLLYLCPLSSLL